jgi:monoamine oxidase
VNRDETFDVVVAGFGFAGAVSALNAAQAGAKTLLLEKSSVPGGLSVCSYGAVRSARDPDKAFAYLKATNAGRTPDGVVRALAQGMCEVERYVRDLGEINNAKITTSLEEAAEDIIGRLLKPSQLDKTLDLRNRTRTSVIVPGVNNSSTSCASISSAPAGGSMMSPTRTAVNSIDHGEIGFRASESLRMS